MSRYISGRKGKKEGEKSYPRKKEGGKSRLAAVPVLTFHSFLSLSPSGEE